MPDRAYAGYGFKNVWVGTVDSEGFLLGQGESAPAQGETSWVKRLIGAQVLPIGAVDAEFVTGDGDDTTYLNVPFDGTGLPSGVLEVLTTDLDWVAIAQGTNVSTSLADDLPYGAINPKDRAFPRLLILAQRRASALSTTQVGGQQYDVRIMPSCNITPLDDSQFQSRTMGQMRYSIAAQLASHEFTGVTFTEANNGTDAMPVMQIASDNPLILGRATGDGGAFDIVTPTGYLPVSQAKTHVWENRVKLTAGVDYTVVTSTGTISLTSSTTDSKIIVAVEYQE